MSKATYPMLLYMHGPLLPGRHYNFGTSLFLMPNAMPIVQQQNEITMHSSDMPMDNIRFSCPTQYMVSELEPVVQLQNKTTSVMPSVDLWLSCQTGYEMPFELNPPGSSPQGLHFFSMEEISNTAASQCPEQIQIEKESQTDPSIFDTVSKEYQAKIRQLESENKDLKCKLLQANIALDSMRKIFTEGQMRSLMKPGNVKWKWNDISSAICLHASGPRAYNHMNKKGFPLPHVTTLQRWCRKVDVSEGVLNSAIEFMRRTTDLSLDEKICVLAFDEMKVEETFEYDPIDDVVRKPANYVQVVMARGLKKSWKQPVFYDFDCKMTCDLLHTIISKLYDAGFPVVAVVCDMGPTNCKFLKELGVTPAK